MKSKDEYLGEYAQSHQNKVNKMIHYICVPLITWSTLGLLWTMTPYAYIGLITFAILYYLILSFKLAIGMLFFISPSLLIITHPYTFTVSLGIFIFSWIVQIWGHKIEGKKPSFLKDLQFLLIGPLWILNKIYIELGIFKLTEQK